MKRLLLLCCFALSLCHSEAFAGDVLVRTISTAVACESEAYVGYLNRLLHAQKDMAGAVDAGVKLVAAGKCRAIPAGRRLYVMAESDLYEDVVLVRVIGEGLPSWVSIHVLQLIDEPRAPRKKNILEG